MQAVYDFNLSKILYTSCSTAVEQEVYECIQSI
jgi:hypothetical protein